MYDKLLTDYANQLALFEEESFVQSCEIEEGLLVTVNDFANEAKSESVTDEVVNLNEWHFMTLDEGALSPLNLSES